MTAQHLTTPHSADVIEKSHHHEGSEGHQVPGPPHAHGHDGHAKPTSGPLVALIAFVLLLAGAVLIGFRAPHVSLGAGARASGGPLSERSGIVVLDDGRVLLGSVTTRDRVVVVASADAGEVLVPRSRVRWMRTDGGALTDEYWRQFGHLPIDMKHQRRGGGIVVIDTGDVFVGNVTQDATGVTVRWPYGSQTHTGEITIPRERVRFVDMGRDTLSEDYWRQHPDAPIDPKWRRGDVAPRQGAARPTPPPAPRDRAATAKLALGQGRWEEATIAYAEIFAEHGRDEDLRNLLKCAERFNELGYESNKPRETTTQVHALLTPFAHLPAVRTKLADMLFKTATLFQVRHDVAEVRRWARALEALGVEQRARVDALLQGASEVERGEEEEAHEHEQGREPG